MDPLKRCSFACFSCLAAGANLKFFGTIEDGMYDAWLQLVTARFSAHMTSSNSSTYLLVSAGTFVPEAIQIAFASKPAY